MDSEILVADFVKMIRKRKWIAVLTTVLITVPVCLYAFITPKLYESDALIFPVTAMPASSAANSLVNQFSGIASLVGLAPPDDDNKKEALAILKSRSLSEEFIIEENLIKEFFSDDWDAVAGEWITAKDDVPTIRDAYEKFSEEILSIEDDRESGMVRVTVRWSDRYVAAEWVNAFIEKADQKLLMRAKNEALRSIEYLQLELAKTENIGLEQVIYGLIQNQMETIMLASVKEEYAFRLIDPAVVDDEDNYVWPLRAVLILMSAFIGMILGCVFAAFPVMLPALEIQNN